MGEYDAATVVLAGSGLRKTVARLALVGVFLDGHGPLALDEARKRCGARGGDQATVYRNLAVLTKSGILREVRSGGRSMHYELAAAHDNRHVHLVCSSCGQIRCLEDTEVPVLPAQKEARGWQVKSGELTLWGVCPDCA